LRARLAVCNVQQPLRLRFRHILNRCGPLLPNRNAGFDRLFTGRHIELSSNIEVRPRGAVIVRRKLLSRLRFVILLIGLFRRSVEPYGLILDTSASEASQCDLSWL